MLPRFIFSFSLLLITYHLSLVNFVEAADTTPPVTQASLNPAVPDGENSWYKTPIEVTLSGSDNASGVASINWRLDGGSWVTQTFSDTLNLAPNPSFEQVSGDQPVSWAFTGQPGSAGSIDSLVSVDGTGSIKIVSAENGWSGFSHQGIYVPVQPFDSITASVWVKVQNVVGQGAYFRIFALGPGGPLELSSSEKITGSQAFTRIGKSFVVGSSDAYGVYLDLGVFGTGSAWFDAVEIKNTVTDTQVVQTFAAPGQHALQFYSVDNSGNQETTQSVNFKIDSTAPSNWRDFSTERAGNDHTLTAEIKVSDTTSRPEAISAHFQYSVDGGSTWGYYSNLENCNSTWNSNAWSSDLTTEVEGLGETLEIKTAPVDYCNSNWQVCKIVRFSLKDKAGNESTKDVCINGSWLKATGDVGSNYSISMGASGVGDNTDGIVIADSGIGNFTSSHNWILPDYGPLVFDTYAGLLTKFPTSNPLPGGKLPTSSGRYKVNSSYTVSATTIPAGFGSSTFSAVVFVNGDLTVAESFSLSSASAILFVVSGDVKISKQVTNLTAVFLVDGYFDTAYNGNSGQALVIQGSVMAGSFDFNRALDHDPESSPAEEVVFRASDYFLLNSQLGDSVTTWREIVP